MVLEEGSEWIHCSASICSYLSSGMGLEEGEGSVLCGQTFSRGKWGQRMFAGGGKLPLSC